MWNAGLGNGRVNALIGRLSGTMRNLSRERAHPPKYLFAFVCVCVYVRVSGKETRRAADE